MSDRANGTSSGISPLLGRAGTLLDGLSARLKDVRANLTEAPTTSAEAPFSDAPALAVAQVEAQVEAQMRPATERAEETLDQAGERLGVFAAAVSHQVRKYVALAREEAEDILAEAQTLRRKEVS